MMTNIKLYRWLTLIGYFGLIILIFVWNLWVEPRPDEQMSLTLILQMGPLLFALRGLLNGKLYTHAWAMYLALFYFIIGVWFAGDQSTRPYGIIFSSLSMIFFIGTVFYTRFQGKAEQLEQQTSDT